MRGAGKFQFQSTTKQKTALILNWEKQQIKKSVEPDTGGNLSAAVWEQKDAAFGKERVKTNPK